MSTAVDIVAWDIGGAHLKLARLAAGREFAQITQRATPLWQGPQCLKETMDSLCLELPETSYHCVTCTAELVDHWPDRETGLSALVTLVHGQLADCWLRFYAGGQGLVDADTALARPEAVMSANWHVTARVAAALVPEGVLLDIGSTSSDLVPFAGGQVQNRGYSDQQRLHHDELIYTGIIRTPVMSLCRRVPLAGRWQGLSNELFATSADIYRITGELEATDDMHKSADQGGKSVPDSLRRLARMVGSDYHPGTEKGVPHWALQGLAQYLAQCQLRQIDVALSSILSRQSITPEYTVIGAGCGSFLAERLARRHGLPYRSFAELLRIARQQQPEANRAASACALAWWTRETLTAAQGAR